MNPFLVRLGTVLGPIIAKELLPLFPVFAGFLAKALFDQLKQGGPLEVLDLAQKGADSIVASDPDIPFLSDIFDVSDWLKNLPR